MARAVEVWGRKKQWERYGWQTINTSYLYAPLIVLDDNDLPFITFRVASSRLWPVLIPAAPPPLRIKAWRNDLAIISAEELVSQIRVHKKRRFLRKRHLRGDRKKQIARRKTGSRKKSRKDTPRLVDRYRHSDKFLVIRPIWFGSILFLTSLARGGWKTERTMERAIRRRLDNRREREEINFLEEIKGCF